MVVACEEGINYQGIEGHGKLGFLHIPVHLDCWGDLGFECEGVCYAFTHLPFGVADRPSVCTSVHQGQGTYGAGVKAPWGVVLLPARRHHHNRGMESGAREHEGQRPAADLALAMPASVVMMSSSRKQSHTPWSLNTCTICALIMVYTEGPAATPNGSGM